MNQLTPEQIDALEAGREMDALIAERVLHLTLDRKHCPYCGAEMWGEVGEYRARCTQCNEWRYSPCKDYSTDITLAMECLDQVRKPHEHIAIEWCPRDAGNDSPWGWWCEIFPDEPMQLSKPIKCYKAFADTPELAICRAALKAVYATD